MRPTVRNIVLVYGLPTLLLSLLFCVLLWLIPADAGLGAPIMIVYFYVPITVGVGIATTIIIFALRLIPRHGELILLGLLLWCVVPIFGGGFLY